MSSSKLNIILFCNRPQSKQDAGTIVDHIDAFAQFSQHNIFVFSHVLDFPHNLDLNRFDVVVIHYSSYLLNNYYIDAEGQKRIREFNGLKILFLQDEYRQVYAFHKKIRELGIHILFTCYPETEIEKAYPESQLPGLIKVNNLTGYVPAHLLKRTDNPPIKKRSIDVGYRTRKLMYWFGRLGQEKSRIADDFLRLTEHMNLITDISHKENERIYGEKWYQFIQSCKTMLGVESGSGVVDFTGEIEKTVAAYQLAHPDESFEEIHAKFLTAYDGMIRMNQISPRCFEAIALKTALILFEGDYSGVLQPWRHYIPLKKDFSNLDEVVGYIRDNDFLQTLVERAYQEIALNEKYSYQTFIQNFDKVLNEAYQKLNFLPITNGYTREQFTEVCKQPARFNFKRKLYQFLRRFTLLIPTPFREKLKLWVKGWFF